MASVNNLYIKRTDFTSMTGDMTFENVKGFYYEGSFYKDFKELYIDGNDLVVITNINNYKTIFKNYVKKPFKLIMAEDEGLIDLIDTGLIQNNEPITEPQRGNTVKGTIYSDNIYLTGYEAPKNIKKLNVNSDKGNDTIIAENLDIALVINAGNGDDIVKVSGGENTISGGKGADEFVFEMGNSTLSVIKDASEEDKIKIVGDISINDLIFAKGGNNLILIYKNGNVEDRITINGYFKSKNKIDDIYVAGKLYSIENLLSFGYWISGKGGISGTKEDDIIIGSLFNDSINAGAGNDTIKTGSGISNIYLTSGGGKDTLINSGGTDTIYFNKNTKYYISYNSDGQTVLNYNSGKDSITIGSYNSETYLKIGNNDAEKVDTSKKFLLGADSTETVTLDGNGKVNLLVVNKYTNKTLTYSLENLSSSQRKFTFTTLENGRLLIKGDYLKMIAEQGQSDDIILMGNNNYVDTSDCNDIVRAGYTVDNLISSYNYKYYDWTSKETYNKSVSNNTIITGDGNDHIILYGNNNKINAGAGSDTMLLKSAGQGNQYTNIDEYYIQWETLIENSQNGKIGLFGQEGRGDCRLFSLLYSLQQHYDMTSDVNDSIRDLVLINEVESGVYNVEFSNYNGPGDKSCEINVNEVYANYGSYKPCSGNIDVFLIDEAMNQLIEKNDESEGYTQVDTVEDADYNTITQYLFGSKKAGFYETKEDLNILANKYFSNDISNLTIGISEMNYMDYYIYEYYYDYLLDYDLEADSNYMSLEKYLAQYKDEIDNYKNSHINNDQLGYITGHAYALKEFNNNCMVLVNPWDSGDCITIDLKGFDSELYDKERNLYISVITYDWGDEKQITNGGEWNKFEKTEDIYIENIAYQTAEWLSSGSVEVSLVDIDNNQMSNIDMQLYTVI